MTTLVVPAKGAHRAKSRLAGHLDENGRAHLSADMLRHVLKVAHSCEAITARYVVSDCTEVAGLARRCGATPLQDPLSTGDLPPLQAVVDHTIGWLRRQASTAVLVVMGDLPCLDKGDLDTLCLALKSHAAVIAPDRHEQGTNALGFAPATRLPSRFGRHDSFVVHQDHLRRSGARFATVRTTGLGLDIDTGADLNLIERLPIAPTAVSQAH